MSFEQDLHLQRLVDKSPSHRDWQLLIVPKEAVSFSLSKLKLFDGEQLLSPQSVVLSRPATSGNDGSSLVSAEEGTSLQFTGAQPVGLMVRFAQAQFVTHVEVTLVEGDSGLVQQAALLQGGKVNGSALTVQTSRALYNHLVSLGYNRYKAVYRERETTLVEPAQSDLDYMTPGGNGRISFYVTTEYFPSGGFPTYEPQFARVQLHRLNDGKVVQTKWSDPLTGRGTFENLDPTYEYAITATHPTHAFQALIASKIRPVVVPEF